MGCRSYQCSRTFIAACRNAMPKKLKLRNAYLRVWFAARADRGLPEADALPERTFLDRGFEAGSPAAGRALPRLKNPGAVSASLTGREIQTVLDEYRARKAARRPPSPDDSISRSTPTSDSTAPVAPPAQPAMQQSTQAPTVKPRTQPGRRHRTYGC